ncbi:MAG: MoxR family ATPase [Butyrivibrio sp.]|nr:MoxR family ATPase [Butyrivibrio sp.]
MNARINDLLKEIRKVLKGKDDVIVSVTAAMLAGGHILLEDIPGVGKTTLAVALSRALSLGYRRVQFTPDVLPSDLLGFNMYNAGTGAFEYREGSVYCNFLLADEINRTSPKTQSALLEVMEEGRATVDGVTRSLPNPFIVLATQNPFGSAGTQKLPESQLDRFMICLTLGYPDHRAALDILNKKLTEKPEVNAVMSVEEFTEMRSGTDSVFVDASISEFIVNYCENTRAHQLINLGLSPRGSIALLKMAKASAFIADRDYVTPDDVISNIKAVCAHRIVLSSKAKAAHMSAGDVLNEVLGATALPKM